MTENETKPFDGTPVFLYADDYAGTVVQWLGFDPWFDAKGNVGWFAVDLGRVPTRYRVIPLHTGAGLDVALRLLYGREVSSGWGAPLEQCMWQNDALAPRLRIKADTLGDPHWEIGGFTICPVHEVPPLQTVAETVRALLTRART